MTDSPCPPDEALRRVLASDDSTAGGSSLQAHLDECESCRARLETFAGALATDDTLRRGVAMMPPTSSKLMATIEHLSSRTNAARGALRPRYDDLKPWINVPGTDGVEFFDGYVLLECIGRGGMGVVFRAIETAQDRIVALKVMLPELARDDRARDRFLREARAIVAVRHPNVIVLFAVSEAERLPYLVMEYVDGHSLATRMRDGAPADSAELRRVGSAIAGGLAACHERGVIHRDIKPSNVLLSSTDGSVKITDFGLAAVASTPTLTHIDFLSGTPDYVAPERLKLGSQADERSDLFSLGCLLYTMATGKEPFGGDTPLITLHRIASEKPPLVRAKNPAISLQLEKTIASLMAKRPQDRPASAKKAQELLCGEARKSQPNTAVRYRWAAVFLFFLVAGALMTFARSHWDTGSNTTVSVKTAAELQYAVESASDGSRIEIDTDVVLGVRPLEIVGKSLTIAAADGRTPAIKLEHDGETPIPDFLISVSNGSLSLNGLQFGESIDAIAPSMHTPDDSIEVEDNTLIRLSNAELSATACRFEKLTVGSCLKLVSGSGARLKDCQLFAPVGSAVDWITSEGDRLELEGCVIASVSAVIATVIGDSILDWKSNTVLTNVAVFELDAVSAQLLAHVSDCLLQSQVALVTTSLSPPSLTQFSDIFAWSGSGNRITGHEVHFAELDSIPDWAREVSAWAAKDHDSVYGRRLFTLPHESVATRLMEGQPVKELIANNAFR